MVEEDSSLQVACKDTDMDSSKAEAGGNSMSKVMRMCENIGRT
jgi:hypothetical protein